MIVDQVDRNVRASNFKNVIHFGIKAKNQAKIIRYLTDKIYNDKPLAVVREYLCNGLDSSILAGSTRPIFITLPTAFEPVLKMRDFGEGMSYEKIVDCYVSVGETDKDESNETDGCFGLGCKAAFAYSDSFNVTSWYNGTCSVYTCQKDNQGLLIAIPISETPSDEPNGVEVSIAIDSYDVNTFRSKLKEFCKYLTVCPEFSEKFEIPKVNKVFDHKNFFIESQSGYGNDPQLLMGNVLYPLDTDKLKEEFQSYKNLVVKANRGDVDITISRESLEYTEKTILFLNSMFEDISNDLKKIIQENVDKKTHIWEAIAAIREVNTSLCQSFPFNKFTFKDRKIDINESSEVRVYIKRDSGTYKKTIMEIGSLLNLVKDNTVLIKVNSEESIITKRFGQGYSEKFGFVPKYIIVTDVPKCQELLFADTWKDSQIVTDYKSLWSKVLGHSGSGGSRGKQVVWAYWKGSTSKGQRRPIDSYNITNKVYFEIEKDSWGSLILRDPKDSKRKDLANHLNIEYYAILKNKVKYLDASWKKLSDVVDKEFESRLKKFNHDNYYIQKELDVESGINEVGTIIDSYRKIFKEFDLDAVDSWKHYRGLNGDVQTQQSILNLAEMFNRKIEVKQSAIAEHTVKTIKDFIKKYAFVFACHANFRYARVSEYKNDIENYIKFLHLTNAQKPV